LGNKSGELFVGLGIELAKLFGRKKAFDNPHEVDAGAMTAVSATKAARDSLKRHGVVVIKNCFDLRSIRELLDNAKRHAEIITQSVVSKTPLMFPEHYRWIERSYACDIAALDPETRRENSHDFNKTSLCKAVLTPPIKDLLCGELGPDIGYALVRTRTILPKADNTGSLAMHQEKTSIRFPGVHVIWTPLVPPGVMTNVHCAGLELHCNDGQQIYPTLQAGDAVIFTGEVPHRTHIPETADHWRIGCDIRVFPYTEENLLPKEAIAIGYGPHRLQWS
jgi:hypothetical protein